MLDSAIQVSVRYLTKKPKHRQDRKNYFRDYYQKNRQKLLAKRKAHYRNQNKLLWSNYFVCKKPYCPTCIQSGIKENQYKICGDNCLVQHWILIYSKAYSKKDEKFGVEQFSPHTRNDILNSTHAPANRLRALVKNLFFLGKFNTTDQSKLERQKRKDQAWRRLATKDKIAQTSNYNLSTHKEKRSLEVLLKQYGEYSYLTGKPLGNYYLSTLDIDLKKVEFPKKLVACLEKNVNYLLGSLRVSYDKTKKGLHIDILTPEILPNEQIYYQGWGKVWNIGSIQSKGKYVVGEDKEKEFIKNGKWYWKVENNEEVKAWLAKFFFILGKQQVSQQKKPLNSIQPTFSNSTSKQIKQIIQAHILSVNKTCLTDLLKVFYWNSRSQSRGYFLLNAYQRPNILPNLNIGRTRKMLLISGTKHRFLNRLL